MSDRALLEELLEFIEIVPEDLCMDFLEDRLKFLYRIKNKAKELRQQLATHPTHECKTCKFEGKSWKYIECRYCIQRYYGDISNRLRYGDKWQPKEDQ